MVLIRFWNAEGDLVFSQVFCPSHWGIRISSPKASEKKVHRRLRRLSQLAWK
jgi:hypothetical protein